MLRDLKSELSEALMDKGLRKHATIMPVLESLQLPIWKKYKQEVVAPEFLLIIENIDVNESAEVIAEQFELKELELLERILGSEEVMSILPKGFKWTAKNAMLSPIQLYSSERQFNIILTTDQTKMEINETVSIFLTNDNYWFKSSCN